MKCIAIDDEPLALELLRKYIAGFPALKLLATFDDAVEGAEYLSNNPVDLLFVDINMPDLSGLDLVAGLQQKPMIIFTTAHKKFAHEGFELEALDYLLKPITVERFERAVNKVVEQFQLKKTTSGPVVSESLVVRSEYKMVKIDFTDIEFIEAMEDYVKIHRLSSTHPVLTLMSIKGILGTLPPSRFSRIHRSYIIPNDQVQSIQNKKVKLRSSRELPVSDSYSDFITQWKKR
jgi:two-component system, LytTR family, response regulator